jgi:poly-gamma-glutamate capsule biosynthesis protein CapA/YwtB (metallophosphatase superfamily)
VALRQYKLELLSIVFILLSISTSFFKQTPPDELFSFSKERAGIVHKVKDRVSLKEKPIITLAATGDVMLGRTVNYQILKNKDPRFPFKKVKDILESADIAYINLENPFTDPCPMSSTGMIFCAPPSSIKALSFAGIDVVNLANNHTKNYGQAGYDSTIESLAKESISYSDSENLATVKVGNTTLGFLGFDLVSKNLSDEKVVTKIKDAAQKVEVLIVGFHWGNEYQRKSNEIQQKYGHAAVDAGADLVIGHHPHVIQDTEEYNGVLIVYSLGNFIFDQMWSEATREGVIGVFNFKNDRLYGYEFIPIYINNFSQPEEVADSEKAEKILSSLRNNK